MILTTSLCLKVLPTPNRTNTIRSTQFQQPRAISGRTTSETGVDLAEQVACDTVRRADLRARLVGRSSGVPAAAVKGSAIGDSAVGGRQDGSTCVARAATGCDYDTRDGVGDVVDATLRRQAEGAPVDPDSREKVVTDGKKLIHGL